MQEPILITRRLDGWVLTAEQTVPASVDEVFDFFSDAGNLETLTPPWLNFQIRTPRPIEMRSGTLIDYTLRLHMIPIRWRTEIRDWNPPTSFVDQQLRGPYRKWVHTHKFTAVQGGTLCQDHVAYKVPCGPLVHGWLVGPDLKRIFTFRQQRIAEIFGTCSTESVHS